MRKATYRDGVKRRADKVGVLLQGVEFVWPLDACDGVLPRVGIITRRPAIMDYSSKGAESQQKIECLFSVPETPVLRKCHLQETSQETP